MYIFKDKRSCLVLTILTVLLFHGISNSQSNIWPEFLAIPESAEDEATVNDSNSLYLTNEFSFDQKLEEKSVLDWLKADERYTFNQQSNYMLTIYNRKSADHSLVLPGYFHKKNFPWPNGSAGIEWIPRLNYKSRALDKTFQSTIDMGPVFVSDLHTIPLKLHTGISVDVWKESIKGDVLRSIFRQYSWDPGYYIGCEIGDGTSTVGTIPLYLSLKATVRSVRNAGLGIVMGNALFFHDPGSGDTLICSVSDSLSNGRESFLNQGEKFLTSPWRVVHGFATVGGLKFAERIGFIPAAFYRFSHHSVNYPSDTSQLNDVRNRSHHINLQLTSFERFFFNYRGGIECVWNSQDWVYKSDALPVLLSGNKDSLRIKRNIDDKRTFTAQMDHDWSMPLPASFMFEYGFHVARESGMYDNFYVSRSGSTRDTTWNRNEKDGVEKSHHFGLIRSDSEMIYGGVAYDYNKDVRHYLRKEQSGSSIRSIKHRIGVSVGLKYDPFAICEEIAVQGEKSEYIFVSAHKDSISSSFDPPPQSRNLNSKLSGSWTLNDRYTVVCTWNEQYGDYGQWYGKEYLFDSTRGDYYAIQYKTNDYSIVVQLEITLPKLNLIIGGSFRDTYSLEYDAFKKRYINSGLGEGYFYEPFIEFLYQQKTISIQGKIRRNINTIDPERWSMFDNWDASLSIAKEW